MNENPFDRYAAEYEEWFKTNEVLFQSEVLAVKKLLPKNKIGIEIGIGSGIFAEKLGIQFGIDPSETMLRYAKQRKLVVVQAAAEQLPFINNCFDVAAFITSLCFIKNPSQALAEAYRILKPSGEILIAILDKESILGKSLEQNKENDKFYRHALFYSVNEIYELMKQENFEATETVQTLIEPPTKIPEIPAEGYGKGGFVVIRGKKK
ncbi:MAG: class I SAM-dependent methyltransferase [Bacteroidetes bacterium]|nr:class I SAM-dependent methyltransferase [Bacteroidota bacterium]